MAGLQGSYRLGKSEGYTNKDYGLHYGGNSSIGGDAEDWDWEFGRTARQIRTEERASKKAKTQREWYIAAAFVVAFLVVVASGGF